MHIDPSLYPALATTEGVRLLCRYLDALTAYNLSAARLSWGLDFYSTTRDLLIQLTALRSDLNHHILSLRAAERPESAPTARTEAETTPGQGEGGGGAPGGDLWRLECPDCRCELALTVKPYPAGPSRPKRCPVCDQGHTGWTKGKGETK